ncbi:SMP-30/gluconolactonase/LRE family protein [Roseomonas sp. OT10]|uniref:SMP-30/gluconolactonase/LRE family protein n=1 Tax=Roseomonas cutis TaxID=2897332 RepID=UPI001E638533|nr:SMP-30/gluconolactonase/LRE family protein [Roseomonas sp. OT10]UFN48460.1 SMP-30/gluconolactonase/LRE family protein [Roseomonas sp. OT10]
MTFRRIGSQRDILGESPVWDAEAQSLFWVDIRRPALRRLDRDGQVETRVMPDLVGSLALAGKGRLLVAFAGEVALYDWAASRTETVAVLPDRPPGHRFNDGRCDRQGRFWVGTMHNDTRAPEGTLFRLDGTRLTPVRDGICIPNSLAWSPDGRTMYFADSLRRAIEAHPFDPRTGVPQPGRDIARTSPPGFPDGSTVDAEGFLWNAEFHSARLVRYAPDGRIDRVVPTPVDRPTSCGFGGPALQTLYVTTTSQAMSETELREHPLAGALLAFEPGVPGLPEPLWKPAA